MAHNPLSTPLQIHRTHRMRNTLPGARMLLLWVDICWCLFELYQICADSPCWASAIRFCQPLRILLERTGQSLLSVYCDFPTIPLLNRSQRFIGLWIFRGWCSISVSCRYVWPCRLRQSVISEVHLRLGVRRLRDAWYRTIFPASGGAIMAAFRRQQTSSAAT